MRATTPGGAPTLAGPAGPRAGPPDPGDPRAEPGHRRHAADLGRTADGPGSPARARGWRGCSAWPAARLPPTQRPSSARRAPGDRPRARSRAARFRGRAPTTVGRGHHVRADLDGRPLTWPWSSTPRRRRVSAGPWPSASGASWSSTPLDMATGRRLDRPRASSTTPIKEANTPVWPSAGACATPVSLGRWEPRRLLRQRVGGELLRHPRMRAAGPPALPHPQRRPTGPLRLYRGVLQHAPPASAPGYLSPSAYERRWTLSSEVT